MLFLILRVIGMTQISLLISYVRKHKDDFTGCSNILTPSTLYTYPHTETNTCTVHTDTFLCYE
jgi:hypothetical protein